MKIVVAQFYSTNVKYGKYTEKINRKYCEENGYEYFVETNTQKIIDKLDKRSWTWYKPHLINEVFSIHQNADYIMFLDIDALFINNNRKIEEFIDESKSIIMTSDYGPSIVNAGVILLKNDKYSKDFIDKWWKICEVFPEYKTGLWHDQTCIGIIYPNLDKSKFKIISPHDLNASHYHKDKFIFHAFSYGHLPYRTIDTIYREKFNIEMDTSSSLTEMAKKYSTDKDYEHNYFELCYNDLFEPIKNNINLFMEIGVYNGESIRLWSNYFQSAKIIGLDIDNKKDIFKEENISTYVCDQSSEEQLKSVVENYDKFDIILDDGSHKMFDQQKSLGVLFPYVKSGGMYIIEDLHTSLEAIMPEKSWCNWGDSNKTITLDMLNYYNENGIIISDYLSIAETKYLNQNIKDIRIYQNKPNWSITGIITKK